MLSVFNNLRQSSLWILWSKVSQEEIYMYHFDFIFHAVRHRNKETNRKSFDFKGDHFQGMQKMTKKWKEPSFLKTLLLVYEKFWFLWLLIFERFAGINFAIAVTEALYFLHPVLSCRLWTFWYFFSELYVSLINCDIAFWI